VVVRCLPFSCGPDVARSRVQRSTMASWSTSSMAPATSLKRHRRAVGGQLWQSAGDIHCPDAGEPSWSGPKSLEPLRFELQHLGMAERRPIIGALSVASRHYVAGQHLWSARHYARLCAELEAEKTGKTAFDIRHRAYAVSAVLSAVVFLEALVNETFQDAADGNASRIAPLDHRCIERMAEFWNSPKGRRAGTRRKFQKALVVAVPSHRTWPGSTPLTCGGPDWLRQRPAGCLTESGPRWPFSRWCLTESGPPWPFSRWRPQIKENGQPEPTSVRQRAFGGQLQ
jgi:hypothetical protein